MCKFDGLLADGETLIVSFVTGAIKIFECGCEFEGEGEGEVESVLRSEL